MACITVPAVVVAPTIPVVGQLTYAWLSGGGLTVRWAQDIDGNVKITIDGTQVTNSSNGTLLFPGLGNNIMVNQAIFPGISQTVHNICVVGV